MGSPRERNAASPNQGESMGINLTNARSIVNKIQELKLYAISASPDTLRRTEMLPLYFPL